MRARGERLDEILAPEGRERAADHCDIAGGVIKGHLAHRVAEMHAVAWRRKTLRAAARLGPLRHFVEAACMARYDDDERAAGIRCREQQILFAIARAREQ